MCYFASSVFVPTNTQNRLLAYPPEVCFCLLVAPAPKPLFAEFHSAATRRSGAFSPAPGGDFLKTARPAYCHNRNLPIKGNGIFSKIRQARRAAASVKRCSKGLGYFPTSKTYGFQHRREPQVLSVCIYKRPACHLYHHL